MDVFAPLRADPALEQLAARCAATPRRPVVVAGLWGSSVAIVAGLIAERLGRTLLLVTAHGDEADDVRDDLETALGVAPALLPQLENFAGDTDRDEDLSAERMRLTLELADQPRTDAGRVIVAPVQALMQPVLSPAAIRASAFQATVGAAINPENLVHWLTENDYQLCEQVEVPGDFARRGGIIDVFAASYADPVRIEFFGDQVDSIRLFDAGTQRSAQPVAGVTLPTRQSKIQSRRAGTKSKVDDTASFLSVLPADAIIAFHEPIEIQELGRTYWQRLGERAGMIPVDALFRKANEFTQIYLQRFAGGEDGIVALDVGSLPQFEPKTADAMRALDELAADCDVVVLCDNPPEEQRFRELLLDPSTFSREALPVPSEPASSRRKSGPSSKTVSAARSHEAPVAPVQSKIQSRRDGTKSKIHTAVGVIHRGFRWRKTAYVPHHELFHRYRQRRTLRKVAPSRPIDSFFDLNTGDHVVHAVHGIGRFRGLQALERDGRRDEYLLIEFADQAQVHVPTSQVHVVQKYIGSFRGKPKLSKLGGTAWKRTKERVAEAVTDLAAELLAVQAQRATQPGIAYPQDTTWQREFEGSFLYEETEDQIRALTEIKTDMSRPRPMDRLLCGDVGFGKTELAMRAAFKTVEYGKQVAVLVPTTVLAEQHYQTFRERMADYPFSVAVLSRFRSGKEQRKIVEDARKGQLDVLIGTHRLLSADVRFADLGLVVIDEEQRFGVEAKEKLKRLRATVDVLTLSATPIPRTLHMSMLGMRDISSLATPPLDRRSIVTQVRMWDDNLIRDAIVREMNRDGQIYFVHNFVRDIEQIANRVRALVPDARVVVGHGQMNGEKLEDVMLRFMRREADVLVSTNIIESGLDIPSANTILIHRAERFGLADLHQLRGRVGRSKHRAYCYLVLSPKHPVVDTAARRLKAIEHFSDLGAGFQIAMRDLEIRGAGNILGPEQSGNIEAVGYEMYCQLLEQAVRKLKLDPEQPWKPVNLDLGALGTIPRAYIRGEKQRMEVYKRLAGCRSIDEVRVLEEDLRDAYGPIPDDVQTLLKLAQIRALAQLWGIRSLVLKPPDVIFAVDDMARVQELFATGPGSPRMPDAHTLHWRLPRHLLEPGRLIDVLLRQIAERGATARVVSAEAGVRVS